MLFWNPLAKVSSNYIASGTQTRSHGLDKKKRFPLLYVIFFILILILRRVHVQTHTCTLTEANPRGLAPFFSKKKKSCSPTKNESLASQWFHSDSPSLAGALITGECHFGWVPPLYIPSQPRS